jgi:ABC-type glutathione transport system ATPase component
VNLLELKNVTFHYRGARSSTKPSGVSSINLLVESGRNLGVIGESGAGKSTLLSLLLGLTSPSSGQILFEDKPLLLENRRQVIQFRTAVQAVFQDPYASLDPRRKIERIVAEPIRSLRLLADGSAVNERVKESLNAVELEESIALRYPHELSGGQRQRVAIARALATHPSILIADEPTSALDVSTRIEVIELLRRLGDERRLTIVMVSHDVSVVASLCKEVVVLSQGRIVEQGPITEILANPKHEYTKKLISAVPRLPR